MAVNKEKAIWELKKNILRMQYALKFIIRSEDLRHDMRIEIIKNELLIKDLEQWDKK